MKKNRMSKKRVDNYEKYYWMTDEIFAHWIVKNLKDYGDSICDIGAGTGFMLQYYSSKSSFKEVAAIEPNDYMISKIKERNIKDLKLQQSDAENINFSNNEFDIVIAKSSLHHFYDIDKALNEMIRISKEYIALIEVVGASSDCIPFLRDVLVTKEPNRDVESIYMAGDIANLLSKYSDNIKLLRMDQYIDLDTWLQYGDVDEKSSAQIRELYLNAPDKVKHAMNIHPNKGKTKIKRCMLLALAKVK